VLSLDCYDDCLFWWSRAAWVAQLSLRGKRFLGLVRAMTVPKAIKILCRASGMDLAPVTETGLDPGVWWEAVLGTS
jgi:hypothetical protein